MPDLHDRDDDNDRPVMTRSDDEMIRVVTLQNLKSFKEKYDVQTDTKINTAIDKHDSHIKNLLILLGILYIIMNVAFGHMLDLQDQQILELENQIKLLRQEVHYATTLTATEETGIDGRHDQETQSVSESESDAGNDSVDN